MHHLDLSAADWDAIIMVLTWLKSFHSVTMLMLTTKHPMLLFTHTVFRGLQEDLFNSIHNLPLSTPLALCNGLIEAHRKLSDYYYKSNKSPYYTWAACTWFHILYMLLLYYSILPQFLTCIFPMRG